MKCWKRFLTFAIFAMLRGSFSSLLAQNLEPSAIDSSCARQLALPTMEIIPASGIAISLRSTHRMWLVSLWRGRSRLTRMLRSNRRHSLLTASCISRSRIISGLSTLDPVMCSGTTTSQPTMVCISDIAESPCTKVGFITSLRTPILFR